MLQWPVCTCAFSSNQAKGHANNIKISEPKPFVGIQNVKDLKNFIWDMEQYFKVAYVPNSEKVNITDVYFW